jgi:hypothetical protein
LPSLIISYKKQEMEKPVQNLLLTLVLCLHVPGLAWKISHSTLLFFLVSVGVVGEHGRLEVKATLMLGLGIIRFFICVPSLCAFHFENVS